MAITDEQIYGSGIARPITATTEGRLATSSGEERLWEAIECCLTTPKGTCALDPKFGIETRVYDNVRSATQIGWDMARAIEYGVPQARDIDVNILEIDEVNGLVRVEIAIVPINKQTPTNRILNVYGLLA